MFCCTPLEINVDSYVLSLLSPFPGSSTACIVVLDRQQHRLHTANLGDSGFLVVRGGEVVHRSDEQQHYFNTPFQLSIAPPEAEGDILSDRLVSSTLKISTQILTCLVYHIMCKQGSSLSSACTHSYNF